MFTVHSNNDTIEELNSLRESLKVISKRYDYDDLGRIKSFGVYKGDTEKIIVNTLTYKNTNNYSSNLIEVENIRCSEEYSRSYLYNNSHNKDFVTSISDSVFGYKSYSYNYRGFLINDNGTTITYDDNGNIKSHGTKSFTYDSTIKDRLSSVDGKIITYSTSNPLLPRQYDNKLYTYEGTKLTSIVDTSDSGYTKRVNYYYNHQGLRVKKVVNIEYNDDRNPEVETTYYYYEGNKLITEYRSDNDRIDFLYDVNGLLYGFINNKTDKYYYVRDILQNILGIVDSNGNLVVKYDCNAYGDNQTITGEEVLLGIRNPFRFKGYYYDVETGLFWCNSRYYNPEWGRWLTPDSIEYLEPGNINGLNLYCYCYNNPISYYDSNGHSPVIANWFSASNIFDLTATLGQLMIGGAVIGGQYAVLNAVRPNNIGIGIWNKMRNSAIKGFEADVKKLNKASTILAVLTVAVQVGEGIYTDINRGYSTDRVISNAVVNTAIYGGTMAITSLAGAKAGAFIGSFCPIPVVGTVVGTAVGFAVGTIAGLLLDFEVNGKSLIDHARDWVYNTWTSWFD